MPNHFFYVIGIWLLTSINFDIVPFLTGKTVKGSSTRLEFNDGFWFCKTYQAAIVRDGGTFNGVDTAGHEL